MNSIVSPENHERARQIIRAVLKKAREVFSTSAHLIPEEIPFSWENKKVGISGLAYRGQRRISLNPLYQNEEDFWDNTIDHEVGHILQAILYPNAKQAHGREWRMIMRLIGGKPERCHSMQIPEMAQRKRRVFKRDYLYECPLCKQEFRLTAVLANKIERKGQRRFCMKESCQAIIKNSPTTAMCIQKKSVWAHV